MARPGILAEEKDLVIRFDVRLAGQYVTAECQLGAHHGCPGGFRNEGLMIELKCRCEDEACSCGGPRAQP